MRRGVEGVGLRERGKRGLRAMRVMLSCGARIGLPCPGSGWRVDFVPGRQLGTDVDAPTLAWLAPSPLS